MTHEILARLAQPWRPALFLALLATVITGPAHGQSFTFVDAYFDGDIQGPTTIDGLSFVFATAVSDDGENVYACSGSLSTGADNAIAWAGDRHRNQPAEKAQHRSHGKASLCPW